MSKMKKMFVIGALALTVGISSLSALMTVKANGINVNYEQYERSAVPLMDNRLVGERVGDTSIL